MSRPRIVFMGTPEFAVASLRACCDVGEVVAVVTQPDKPRGRGQELAAPPVKVEAQSRQLEVLQPPRLKNTDFAEVLRSRRPDVCVVTAYGRILPKEVLEVPRQGCLNVHASLLPRFRGAAPIQRAIAAGDEKTGVCLMKMDEGLDTGGVIACRERRIGPEEDAAALFVALAELGADLLREALPAYLRGELRAHPQPEEGVVLAPLIDKEEGRLDFARSAAELERRLRAFTPWPGAFTTFGGALLKIHRARVVEGKGPPGELLRADAEGLVIACGEGALALLEVQPEGKRRMSAAEFTTGRRLERGSRPFGEGR